MNTTIKIEDANASLLEEVKAFLLEKKIVFSIEKQKDDTKMSKEAFFAMIDEARRQPTRRVTIEELKNRYL